MKLLKIVLSILLVLCLIIGSSFFGYVLSFRGRIYKNIIVAKTDVGGLTKDQAIEKLKFVYKNTPNKVELTIKGNSIGEISVDDVDRDFKWAVDQAYILSRSGDLFVDIKIKLGLLFKTKDLDLPISIRAEDIDAIVETVSGKVDQEPIWPALKKDKNTYTLSTGKDGLILNKEKLKEKIKEALTVANPEKIEIPVEVVSVQTDKKQSDEALKIINSWKDKKITLNYKEFNKEINEETIAELLNLSGDFFVSEKISTLTEEISNSIETDPKDAVFEFADGRVKEFKPEVWGIKTDKPKFYEQLELALRENKDRVEVPVISTEPKIKTSDINNFGIKELIGVGKSSFGHSIPSRVFNVALAASRINGVIVAPGEEFSFVNSVGEINRQNGYQTAYVISQGKTVLGDGGGVCQVSTTVFRAALNFGFPITERKAHAYRVGYYEQDSAPGIDATIFSPSVDFKFKNDTEHHILIQTKVDTKNLTMRVEIYGTNDGRKATVSKPIITSQTPAPATMYVDDPTLPKGTKKQIDWSAPGAKVSFDYKVEKNGETTFERKFVSNYQPWQAVYLVGTGN